MNQEQANAWAEAEKARAREAYQVGEAQRSFEFGWQKAFATSCVVAITSTLKSSLNNMHQRANPAERVDIPN